MSSTTRSPSPDRFGPDARFGPEVRFGARAAISLTLVACLSAAVGCATTTRTTTTTTTAVPVTVTVEPVAEEGAPPRDPDSDVSTILRGLEEEESGAARPIPNPIVPPADYERAVAQGTRSRTGAPGPRYWQQSAEYSLFARLETGAKRLRGRAEIRYQNESPDTLEELYLHLSQNVHADGGARNGPLQVTGGVQLDFVSIDGTELFPVDSPEAPGYMVDGTLLRLSLIEPLHAGSQIEIETHWWFDIPQQGAGARMGWSEDNFFYMAYWYPQMAVYDDVVGWQLDQFLGGAEFYTGFGSYDLEVEAPHGWLVRATGQQLNEGEVFPEMILDRLQAAEGSDSVVHLLTEADLGPGRATRRSNDGWLLWRFQTDKARDAAFSVSRNSLWDATRTPVGDRNGDGQPDYARIESVYRPGAGLWVEAARYAQHAIDFHSRFTGFPYPWPHMTAIEGGGIISGGMEFPMQTLIGDYNVRGDSALYYVTAHELAHMWVPMIVGSDERRYAWMDEGMTTFLENQARREFYPGNPADSLDQETYLDLARADGEGEMMRWTDYQYPGAGGVASYSKPASLLVALRGLLGEETFMRGYRTFISEWAFRHPKPWDFFQTFERVSGEELGWFWRSWYYETWTLDQAIGGVSSSDEGVRIRVEDRGDAPMPTRLRILRIDGTETRSEIPVSYWLAGARSAEVVLPPGLPVVRVEIDPEGAFPDIDRTNNVWVP
jgi:hypothetical protein